MKLQVLTIRVCNNNGKGYEEENSENDLTFTEHMAIFMRI